MIVPDDPMVYTVGKNNMRFVAGLIGSDLCLSWAARTAQPSQQALDFGGGWAGFAHSHRAIMCGPSFRRAPVLYDPSPNTQLFLDLVGGPRCTLLFLTEGEGDL
jgi:hypothetical protein